jgi:polar amino acid transport system substrate-binding protein
MFISVDQCDFGQCFTAEKRQPKTRFPYVHRTFRRLALVVVTILCLIVPGRAAAQPLTIVSSEYPPLGYVKDGEIVGITVDLIKVLLKRTGIDGKFAMYSWPRAYEMAQTQKDVAIYTLTYSEERARLFQLVGPIVQDTECFFKLKTRKDVVVKDLNDAKRYRIGVVRGSFARGYLLERGFEEGKNVETVHEDDLNAKKLASGRIDLMLLPEKNFIDRVKRLGYKADDFENAMPVFFDYSYLAFSKQTSPDVVARFATELDAIKKDGSYYRIMGPYAAQPTQK